jgi:hypothetical protein
MEVSMNQFKVLQFDRISTNTGCARRYVFSECGIPEEVPVVLADGCYRLGPRGTV